jgi:hypothetical protein
MAVRDFFQKEEVEEEEEEVEAVEELTVDGRSLRDDEEEEEKEGLSRGLLRGCSVAAGDGEGSGRERRRRAEGSRESALWSVTMSRARAASPASPPRGWSPPPPWWWGKRDDIASGAWALGWVGGFPGGDLKRAARPATWGRRTDTDKGERSGGMRCFGGAFCFVVATGIPLGAPAWGDADALCFGGARRAALARCFVCELDLGSPSSRSKAGRKEFPSRES